MKLVNISKDNRIRKFEDPHDYGAMKVGSPPNHPIGIRSKERGFSFPQHCFKMDTILTIINHSLWWV